MSGSRARDGILEVEYGFYPQQAVSLRLQQDLEFAFRIGLLQKTGCTYTTDSVDYDKYGTSFCAVQHVEYEYHGKRYVRVTANCSFDYRLSNGEKCSNGDVVWVEVQPIKWLVDERRHVMLCEKIVFAGVQFHEISNYNTSDWNQTGIKHFMDQYFSKEMLQGMQQNYVANGYEEDFDLNDEKSVVRRKNPYDFDFENVSEEDIVKGAVESGIAVFLHGRSSEGKSARVKQLDPDCEIVYLRNATPESLNGKSVYNAATGEMIDIPPTWFKKIEAKCNEEPDKIHIIFFDEITNALPSIQGMAFNIVLDGEVNGIWKLPKNCRLVAAGNDLNDSLAANQVAEPLFNRFAHAYINTTVENWLNWAATPKEEYERLDYKEEEAQAKIHPAIYSYIAYKSYSGEDVLRTPYTGDKPNADPRKWEMASKVLYATKKPELLRALVGEDITRDFVSFCEHQVISVEDVLNENYTNRDFEMNIAEKFATAVGLSSVDKDGLETVRNFVMKLGPEICATFDNLWVHGDDKRLEKIAELRAGELSEGGISR